MRDIPDVEVTFRNGQKDKFVLYHHAALPHSTNIDQTQICSYLGYLENELNATVGLTGCLDERNEEGKIYITMLSSRSRYQKSFSVDFNGSVLPLYRVEQDNEHEMSRELDEFFEGDEIGDMEEETRAHAVVLGGKNSVPYAIRAKVKLGIDVSAMHTILNKLDTTVDSWLTDVVTHLQVHYHHPTLRHRITFEVRNTY